MANDEFSEESQRQCDRAPRHSVQRIVRKSTYSSTQKPPAFPLPTDGLATAQKIKPRMARMGTDKNIRVIRVIRGLISHSANSTPSSHVQCERAAERNGQRREPAAVVGTTAFRRLDAEPLQNLEDGLLVDAMVSGEIDYRNEIVRHVVTLSLKDAAQARRAQVVQHVANRSRARGRVQRDGWADWS